MNEHGGHFDELDRAADPSWYVRFMDMVHADPAYHARVRERIESLRLRDGAQVLDIGSGTGVDAQIIARTVAPSGRVIGMDYSETMVDEARRRANETGLPVAFQQGDAHQLDFADDSFDLCWCNRTIFHLADPGQAIAEMARVTRPGGQVIVYSPDFDSVIIDAPDINVVRRLVQFRSDESRSAQVGRQLPRLFRQAGLADIVVQPQAVVEHGTASAMNYGEWLSVADRARDQGIVTPEEAAAWGTYLTAAASDGRWLLALITFNVSGRKPGQPA